MGSQVKTQGANVYQAPDLAAWMVCVGVWVVVGGHSGTASPPRPVLWGGLEHSEVELRDRGNPPLDDQGNVYAVTNTSILVACDRDGTSLWT